MRNRKHRPDPLTEPQAVLRSAAGPAAWEVRTRAAGPPDLKRLPGAALCEPAERERLAYVVAQMCGRGQDECYARMWPTEGGVE